MSSNTTITKNSPWNLALFVCAAFVVWAAYFLWRPPLPMLFMKHEEHLPIGSQDISLTLDDSPHPLTTPLLLASLRSADVKATFFCVGEGLRLYPELAHRMVAEGHHLANHSQPHHNLTTVVPEMYPQHIDACFYEIHNIGQAASIPQETRLFRPPGGGLDRNVMNYLYKRDYTLAWWSNNVGDWTCPPAWKIADGVKANLKAGDILLLHDGGTGTPQAIPAIVKAARARGFNFILMPQG